MPRGQHLKNKGGKLFSTEHQPSPSAKSVPKRITRIRKAIDFFSDKTINQVTLNDGSVIELTYESNIAYQLLLKCNAGDLHAIKILAAIMGWNAPTNQRQDFELSKLIESGDIIIDNSGSDKFQLIPKAN